VSGARRRPARAPRKQGTRGGIGEAFVPHVAHAGWAPGGTGLSGRSRHGLTTGGARADRVGAKLPMRGPSGVPRGRGHPPKAASSAAEPGWPLTREPSVGVVFDAYPGFRKGARRRLPPSQGGCG